MRVGDAFGEDGVAEGVTFFTIVLMLGTKLVSTFEDRCNVCSHVRTKWRMIEIDVLCMIGGLTAWSELCLVE